MTKTRIIAIPFLILIFSITSKAIDAEESRKTTWQIDSLNSVATESLRQKDYKTTLECRFKISDLYKEQGEIDSLAISYNHIVGLFNLLKDNEHAEKYQRLLAQTARKTSNSYIIGLSFLSEGKNYTGKGDYDSAIRNYYIAYIYFQRAKRPDLEGHVYKILGDAFVQKKKYDQALFAYRTANSFFSQIHDESEIAIIYTRIAYINQVRNDDLSSLAYNLKARYLREKIGNPAMISSSYLNIGGAYWKIGKKDSARIYLQKALYLADSLNHDYLREAIYFQLYSISLQEKNYKEAFQYYSSHVEYGRKLSQEQTRSEIALLVANLDIRTAESRNELLLQENQIQALTFRKQRIQTIAYEILFLMLIAVIIFINSLAITNRNRKTKLQFLNEKIRSEIQERIEAETNLHKSEELHRSLAENTVDVISLLDANMSRLYISPSCEKIYGFTPAEMLQMNTPLDLIAPSHRVTVNYKLLELFRTKKSTQYRYKALRKDGSLFWAESNINPILDPETGEIKEMITVVRDISGQMIHEEELAENARQKDYLLREIHNRVKNNFAILISLMNMQRDQSDDSELNSSITELQLRVRTMSLVHEQLYNSQDITNIPFGDYLQNLAHIIEGSYKNERIRLETDIKPCVLAIVIALPMGLIVNELMTNAYKYAFPGDRTGTVGVKLLPEGDDKYSICIFDDGIGLPDGFTLKNTRSMGSQIVQILVEQVEGQIEYSGKNGAWFRILFSANPEK